MSIAKKNLQILVVEDDMLDRKIIKKALADSGIEHELVFAEDHESGKAATLGVTYDCIFLDYNLPGGTGLELLKAIRENGNTSPIIIVTSQGDEKLAVEAMKNGANDYIPKNLLSADGISQTVRYMINMKEKERLQRELEEKLKETQRQLNMVVANAPIILFSIDDQGCFRLFEGKGIDHTGLNRDAFLNKNINEQNYPFTVADYNRAITGEEYTTVVEWSDRFFEVYYSPITIDEHRKGVIGIATDITIHKRAEEQLTKAKQLAEETAKVKEQFLANMSHEIRTPMNGIMGLTHILLNTELNDDQRKYLDSISSCTNNLLVIINDILDFTKIEAGKMTFENVPFSLNTVINNTIELFQIKADEKSLQLVADIPDTLPSLLSGDPTRLSQILNNLVSNAIKFTEKGEVRIKIYITSRSDDSIGLTFDVKDSGIGIAADSLSSVFESFTQASSDTTRKFGGTGLGLTIVKKLIELQEGNISVSSTLGTGTTFSFQLMFPVAAEEIKEDKTAAEADISISHLRILIAEDNKINQLIVRKLFQDWKTTIELADNGQIAIEKLSKNDYDLVLMDIQMPIVDGYTAAEHIRSSLPAPKCSTPIMAMTAHATQTEKQKCFDKGMNDYISKPFEPMELKKKIIELTNNINHRSNHHQTSNPDKVKQTTSKENEVQNIISEPKINLTYLKQIAEGNDTFIIEMIEMFLNKTPEALEEMDECFRSKNWQELRMIAHKIKPSYGYFGMSELQSKLAEIEALSEQEKDPAKMAELIQNVSVVSFTAFEELKRELTGLK